MTHLSKEVESYCFLWDGTEPGWCLVNVGSPAQPEYALFNKLTKETLLIESDEIAGAVIEKMLSEDTPVWQP